MKHWLLQLDRCAAALSKACLNTSALFIILLVLLTAEQVVARYLFDSTSIALQEFSLFIFGAAFLLAMGPALRQQNHVRVDIFYEKMPNRIKRAIDFGGSVLFLIPTAICLIYFGYKFCAESQAYANYFPHDRITAELFDSGSWAYQLIAPMEGWFRAHVLAGEASANPGGMEGIWIAKAFIPLGGLMLLLEGIVFALKNITPDKEVRP